MVKKLQLVTGAPDPDSVPTPSDLGEHGRHLWEAVQREYRLIDVGGIALLVQACRALDRAESCRTRINAEGETIKTKHGLREHPLLKHELANRSFVARSISRLGLDVEPLRTMAGRPPGYA